MTSRDRATRPFDLSAPFYAHDRTELPETRHPGPPRARPLTPSERRVGVDGARLFELQHKYGRPVEASEHTDRDGFKSYRIVRQTETMKLPLNEPTLPSPTAARME
jgi:hypothetical protein